MAEPSLTTVFGAGATQDANTLLIAKADLVAVGLTPATANTAESLLAAILKKAHLVLTQENQSLSEEQHCVIQNANASIYESAWGSRVRQNLLVSFDNTFNNPGIQPDNY